MARKKSSPAEDFIEIISALPWWLGVVLALVFYIVLHTIANRPVTAPVGSAQIGQLATHALWRGLATIGQYVLPTACVLGAILSFSRRKKREALVRQAANAGGPNAIDGMSWQDFELLVAEVFRLQGYSVLESGGPAPDGGVDVELRKGTELFLVQCKQWKANQVGVQVLREFYGVMVRRGAAGGFVVTSGRFTDDAIAFAEGTNLRLVDGNKLAGLLRQARTSGRVAPVTAATPQGQSSGLASSPPACPVCRAPMKRRSARRGASAGSDFWGCTRFPSCRGTRDV